MQLPRQRGRLPLVDPPMVRPAQPTLVVGVFNPIRPKARWAIDQVRLACARADWPEPDFVATTIAEPGAAQAAAAVAGGAGLVLAMGGDGTVRSVARGLAHTGVPMGVVPLGTANLFARNLLLSPGNLRRTVRLALHGVSASVDLGRVSVRSRPEVGEWLPEETFLALAGIGHDAATVSTTTAAGKSALGWLAYLGSGARHLNRRPFRALLGVDQAPVEEVSVWSILIGNCGLIPGGVAVFPKARVDDGRLELMQVRLHHPAQWFPVAGQGLLRRPVPGSGLVLGECREVRVVPEVAQPVQLDGDVLAAVGEAHFRVDPGALLVRLDPRSRAAGSATGGRKVQDG